MQMRGTHQNHLDADLTDVSITNHFLFLTIPSPVLGPKGTC